jgi:hypothetical protein
MITDNELKIHLIKYVRDRYECSVPDAVKAIERAFLEETTRDKYAVKILAGLLASPENVFLGKEESVSNAIYMADKLIEELNKEKI